MQHLTAYLYADDGLLVSMWATHLQQDFDTLTELFDRVGLRTNVAKMVSMACQPCRALGVHSSEGYRIQITGEGLSFRDRICQRVCCPNCNVELAAGSLEAH